MNAPLRILLTNCQLSSRSGTELYTAEVATELARQGHLPVVFSPQLGQLADELRSRSVPVVDQLQKIAEPPDVIHGHHALETMSALLHFPEVPAIFVCHDCSAWHDEPPRFSRLRRYVAVDGACHERLVMGSGLSPEHVVTLQNGVDLRRFPRRTPLPERPRRALLLNNYVDPTQAKPIRAACDQAGLELDLRGQRMRNVTSSPELELPKYDVVFAKARCAWEALAVGTAVVICGAEGAGPMVTSGELSHLMRWNFGRRVCQQPLAAPYLLSQLQRYNRADAALVTDQIRATSGLEYRVGQLAALYYEVIDEQRRAIANPTAELAEAATFLHWWSSQRITLVREQANRLTLLGQLRRLWQSLRRRWMPSVPMAKHSTENHHRAA